MIAPSERGYPGTCPGWRCTPRLRALLRELERVWCRRGVEYARDEAFYEYASRFYPWVHRCCGKYVYETCRCRA